MIENEDKKVNVSIIGCGYWGPNLIRNFSQIDLSEVYYVCDIDETKLATIKKTYPTVKTTTDYLEILKDPKVDAVVIALPVFKHYQIAKDALLNNKHVLIEKPMTASSEEAKELINLAQERDRVLMVDHTFEYAEAINKIKEIISSGELGDLYYIRAEWLNLGLLQPDINVIWDLATHIISIINYTTNLKARTVNANAEGYIRKDIPEISQIHIKFQDNISAYLTVGWLEPKKTRKITIVGSKKLLVYDLTEVEEPIKIYDKGIDLIDCIEDTRQFKVNYKYGDISSPNIKNIEPLKTMCLHLIECIKNQKRPRSDGKSGLNVIRILESIDKSLKENGREIILEDDN